MKGFVFTFIFAVLCTTVNFSSHLLAQNKNLTNNTKKLFKVIWTGNEKKLFCNIDLKSGLVFADKYKSEIYKDGQSCTIFCVPSKEAEFISSKGHKLKEIKITVELFNVQNEEMIDFELVAICTYEDRTKRDEKLAYTRKISQKGSIVNPAVSLEKRIHFITNESSQKGRIEFKNSVPFSLNQSLKQ